MPFRTMASDIYRPTMLASLLAVFIDIRLGLTNTQALFSIPAFLWTATPSPYLAMPAHSTRLS